MNDEEYEKHIKDLEKEVREDLAKEIVENIRLIGITEVFEAMIQASVADAPAQILLRGAQHAYAELVAE